MLGRSTSAASALLLVISCFGLAACGPDGTGVSEDVTTDSGTCDARASQNECLEVSSTTPAVSREKTACTGEWTTGPCPTDAGLLGCCVYFASGGQYRECFYAGAALDPEEYCATSAHGNWYAGTR